MFGPYILWTKNGKRYTIKITNNNSIRFSLCRMIGDFHNCYSSYLYTILSIFRPPLPNISKTLNSATIKKHDPRRHPHRIAQTASDKNVTTGERK